MIRKIFRHFGVVIFCGFMVSQAFAEAPSEISTRDTRVTQVVRNADTKNPYQVTGESLVFLLTRMVDLGVPGSSIVFERRSGQIFIKQTQAGHAMVEKILSDLRHAAFRQVEIEARFLTVSSQDFRGVGIDFAALNAALTKAGIVIGTAGLGAPALAVVGASAIDFPDITGSGPSALGQQLSFFGHSKRLDFQAVYDALQTQGEVNTLSAPKIMVFNNQRAHIRIERIENYVAEINSSLASQGTGGAAAAIVQTEAEVRQAQSGTILDVLPTLNVDGTITLELHPQFVTANLSQTQTVSNITGGKSFPNSVTLPVFKGQEIDTTVTIPDGGVAVMGGLIQDQEDKHVESVPLFDKVPILGKLLSSDQVRRTKSYLLIFIQAREKGYSHEKEN